jgi:CHAT domain
MEIRLEGDGDWRVVPAAAKPSGAERGGAGRRRGGAIAQDVVPARFLNADTSVALVTAVAPRPRRGALRGAELSPIDASVEVGRGESAVMVARHPSGALTFHPPIEPPSQTTPPATKGAAEAAAAAAAVAGPRRLHFRVEMAEAAPARRGLIAQAIKLAVVKVAKAAVDKVVAKGVQAAGRIAEAQWWKQKGLAEGWYRLRLSDGGKLALQPLPRTIDPGDGPALILLHGTFSNLAGSFGKLLTPAVFEQLRARYGDRIFGFQHFSVSRSPEENVQALLKGLPDREVTYDLIGYSRGGLVLRALAELPSSAGPLARRFKLGRAVLVAVPNGGTPLATGGRWENTLGLVANIADALPDNPWTMAADFVASGIVWLASHASADMPGLAAMDGNSPMVKALREGSGPAAGRYSAIGANHHPDAALWRRLVDAGIDSFFAGANDLVVPTDGAWQIAPLARDSQALTADRIACFGFDGNVQTGLGTVHHLNVLGQPETRRFITRALAGEPQGLPPLDLSQPRKSRQIWRGRASAVAADAARVATEATAAMLAAAPSPVLMTEQDQDRTLHLMVLAAPSPDGDTSRGEAAQILAMYGGARVVEEFPLRNRKGDMRGEGAAGTRFRHIIDLHDRISLCLDSMPDKTGKVPTLPNGEELRAFGTLLFETLFSGGVRRLYDLARTEQRHTPLNIVFTCEIPWVASKPWEFAYDPNRRKFLATEEIHFVRNVFTAVPAQWVDRRTRLRMLVVEAQPAGTAPLAIQDEEERIRHRFQPLLDANLIEIEVLAHATAERLHERVFSSSLERRPFDIVHFIGHGEFARRPDDDDGQGQLLFHSMDGGVQRVNVRTLREILCNRGIQIVFLNACDTARDARGHLNRGVGQALMEGGLPAVVANQYSVLDPSAVAFAQYLYWTIAQGASIGEAAREARIAVNYSITGDLIDWAVPVVYARDPNYRLCRPAARVTPLSSAPRSTASSTSALAASISRGEFADRTRIGIADIGEYFPELESMLDRFNEVQERFLFREVKIVVPLGVWDRVDGRRYLNASRFMDRIKDKVSALGVDHLVCITNWWMRAEGMVEPFGALSAYDLPIIAISTAPLLLPTQGPDAARAVANCLVASLAAQILTAKAKRDAVHARGPRTCPFHLRRSIDKPPTQRMTFDDICRKRLLNELGKDVLKAFDALLAAYDA